LTKFSCDFNPKKIELVKKTTFSNVLNPGIDFCEQFEVKQNNRTRSLRKRKISHVMREAEPQDPALMKFNYKLGSLFKTVIVPIQGIFIKIEDFATKVIEVLSYQCD